MQKIELFKEFSDKKVRQREEERVLLTANTDRQVCRKVTPNEIGKEIIRLMLDEIINWKER